MAERMNARRLRRQPRLHAFAHSHSDARCVRVRRVSKNVTDATDTYQSRRYCFGASAGLHSPRFQPAFSNSNQL